MFILSDFVVITYIYFRLTFNKMYCTCIKFLSSLLISSYMKRFQCYSAQKSFLVGGGGCGGIAIIATSSRSRSLIRDLRLTLDLDPSLTIVVTNIKSFGIS